MNSIIQAVLAVIGLIILIVALGLLNQYSNAKQEKRCTSNGGEYFKAIDSTKSFCKVNK